MVARVIDGNAVSSAVEEHTVKSVSRLRASGITPGLAVVLVGDDPASASFVSMKERDCARVGIRPCGARLATDTQQPELNAVIDRLNADPDVHGIQIQLPLPAHLDAESAVARVLPEKDVGGTHPVSMGRLVRGLPAHRACTPLGVMRLLEHYGIDPVGMNAVVVGRSTIVGKPLALMLLEANATVTVCHSQTRDLADVCRRADLLVAAVGRPRMLDGSYVKPGAVVIDVGITSTEDGLVGDVDYDVVAQIASAITPVPGGVGPMTRAMLLSNTIDAALTAMESPPSR